MATKEVLHQGPRLMQTTTRQPSTPFYKSQNGKLESNGTHWKKHLGCRINTHLLRSPLQRDRVSVFSLGPLASQLGLIKGLFSHLVLA